MEKYVAGSPGYNTLIKAGSERIEATLCNEWILFARFLVRMEDTRRLTKGVGFGGWWVRFPRRDKKKSSWGVFRMISVLSLSKPASG